MKNFLKILPKIFTKRQTNAGMGTLEMIIAGAMWTDPEGTTHDLQDNVILLPVTIDAP